MYLNPPSSRISAVLKFVWQPEPFQSPAIGLGSKFTTTPNNKVTLTEGIPINIEYEEDNLRTENVTLMIGATVKRKEEFSEIETEYSKYH